MCLRFTCNYCAFEQLTETIQFAQMYTVPNYFFVVRNGWQKKILTMKKM